MGTFGLERYDTPGFQSWLGLSGYVDEYDFWSSLSSLTTGTTHDHMEDYLSSLGYTGTRHDKLRQFFEAQVGGIGTVYDMATVFYESAFSVGVSDGIVTESGDPLTTESGDQLFTEGD